MCSGILDGEVPDHSRRRGVAEGLCRVTRNVLNGFLSAHGLMEHVGENSQLLAVGIYVEHVASKATEAWSRLPV